LRGRLALHCASNPSNSVLARHLAADSLSAWAAGRTFTARKERRAFLTSDCYFRVLPVPNLSRKDLERLESSLIQVLRPAYSAECPLLTMFTPIRKNTNPSIRRNNGPGGSEASIRRKTTCATAPHRTQAGTHGCLSPEWGVLYAGCLVSSS
jgi:hypothetical protein